MRAVIFDLDGTLYKSAKLSSDIWRNLVKVVAEELGISEEKASEFIIKGKKRHLTVTRTVEAMGISRIRLYERLAKSVNPSEYLNLDPRLQSLVDELHDKGYKVAVATDSGRSLAVKILDAIGILNKLDSVATSSEAAPKPEPNIYLYALSKLNIWPNQAVYVGDRLEEARGAKQAGLSTLLLSKLPVDSPWVDFTIRDLNQLPKILEHHTPFIMTISSDGFLDSSGFKGITRLETRLEDVYQEFQDRDYVEKLLRKGQNPIIRVRERINLKGEGLLKLSVQAISSGKIGKEYFLTPLHVHDKSELMVGISGKGLVLLQCGELADLKRLERGKLVYIPPRWAHRCINIGNERFVYIAIYDSEIRKSYGMKPIYTAIEGEDGKPKLIHVEDE
ncbi:MAG: Glucose-6-phosphate isomerase [Candidatus Bathyarchaeota archaeon BA2]|nr:MAG: Glucose-6-phosphate isomerase [Candidatus Bathyarchaeota archaeon BA2]